MTTKELVDKCNITNCYNCQYYNNYCFIYETKYGTIPYANESIEKRLELNIPDEAYSEEIQL